MTIKDIAKYRARYNGNNIDAEINRQKRRQRDINLYGYDYAFKHDSVMTYEKAEYLRKNNKLKGEE